MIRSSWGRWLPVLFLLLSLGVAGVGALEAVRAHRTSTKTAELVLQDYGAFAAWSYQQRVEEMVAGSIIPSLAIARQTRIFEAGLATEACLGQILVEHPVDEDCGCAPPVTGGYSFFIPFQAALAEGDSRLVARGTMWAGSKPAPELRSELADRVRLHGRTEYEEGRAFAIMHVPETMTTPAATVAYTLLNRAVTGSTTRDTIAYGMEVDPDRFAQLFQVALTKKILPPSLTGSRPNEAVMAVEVLDPRGRVLYSSSPQLNARLAAETSLRSGLGGGTIRASVLPSVANELIIGGLPSNRIPLLLLLFGTAITLAVLAVAQARREDRLAALRQDFVASVSHELRTPLAQVRLFTETLLLGRVQTEEQRDWALGNIERETHRLANLVENILHFSRSERGVVSGEQQQGDLSAAVLGAVDSFQLLVPDGRATLVAEVPTGLQAEFHADSVRQVVLNLLDNAVRYGPAGQTVRVTAERMGDAIQIAVGDQGPGVPRSERHSIFEPFRRGSGDVGSVAVGSGIGLAVVKEIVVAHGGHIRVEDASEGGARFVFTLCAPRTAHVSSFSDAGHSGDGDRSEVA